MSAGLALRPIVVGVSGSAASHAALRWAAREAWLRGTPLHVVRAWESAAGRIAPYAWRARAGTWEEDAAVARMRLEEAVHAVLGPASPHTGPLSPVAGPASPVTGPASQVTGPASAGTGPASAGTTPTSPVTVAVELAEGLPARVLLDRAQRASMLVLGSGADAGGGDIGPVAQDCLRGAPCPVVAVSPERPGMAVPA